MRLRWGLGAGVSWIALAVLVVGCSSVPPVVRFGTAQPSLVVRFGTAQPSGSKLGLHAPAGGYLPAAQWPDSCTLLSDQELRSVLPQASDISHKQKALDLMRSDTDFHTDRIPAAGCEISFRLPAKDHGTNSQVALMILAIGDPSLMKKQLQDRMATQTDSTPVGAGWGADDCYSERFSSGGIDPTAYCVAGQYCFDVSVGSRADYFERKGDQDNSGVQEVHDKVLPQVVRIIAAAMS
jgi:hypothetical protein